MAAERTLSSPREGLDDADRLTEIVDVVVGIASNDFSRRARVLDGSDLLDGLAAGINMLAEEIGAQQERERAIQQQMRRAERLAAIGKLAAGVAHEINNPAAFVLANLQTLEQLLSLDLARLPDEVQSVLEQAREINRSSLIGLQRITTIVRDLKNFARVEEQAPQSLAVDLIVEDACRLAQAEVAYRAHLVVHRVPGIQVRGNRTRLTQVLTNLLFNAAQAIPEGNPARHTVTVATAVEDGVVTISVRDTGSGIRPDVQPHLFEPLFTTKGRDHGTGLGLAISADIARQHGGELTLVQTSPLGTTFALRLPAERPPRPAADKGVASAGPVGEAVPDPPTPVPAKPRVLVIDDEPLLLLSWQRLFARDYDIQTALGGRAGVQRLEQDGAWDAVVCDLMMPDLDGAAVHEWIRQHRPALAARILFCTGGAFTPRAVAFADLMGDRLLQKPVLPDDLRAAIAGVVRLQS